MIGIDISLAKTGICIIGRDGALLYSGLVKSKPSGDSYLAETKRIVKIAEDIIGKIDEFCPETSPALVVIEAQAFMARNTSAITQIAGLSHLVRTLLAEFEWPCVLVAPSSLKKFITGKGNADKNIVMLEIFKQYGHTFMEDNTADSFALAAIGMALLGEPLKPLLKPQQEVIELLEKQLDKQLTRE